MVYICYACVVNFDGGPFSVGFFNRGGHIIEPDRVADERGYTMYWAARKVSKRIAI